MEISITEDNINEYLNNKFNDITSIKWLVGELDKRILDNFPCLKVFDCCNNQIKSLKPLSNCINLQILYCDDNQITSLEPLSVCTSLQKLYCVDNQITSLEPLTNCVNLRALYCTFNQITLLEPISNCINLQILCCAYNKITSLQPLSKCINLRLFYCDNNKIASLEPLSKFTNLHIFYCNNNKISSLEPLSKCVNLQELSCNNNQLTSLEPLSNFVNLQEILCSQNQITSLEPLSNCVNLMTLLFRNNQITSLEPLIYLRRLSNLCYSINPIEIPTMQIQRMLDRIQSNHNSSIYYDNQNVHDIEIQRTVCDSVQSLLKDPKKNFTIEDVIGSGLNKSTIESLIEYCQDQSIHSVHLITYTELLALVWNRIINSVHKSELLKIMNEQIADSECKCFTGRFNRTLSVLVGFFDDIKINISNKSRISAIVLNCRDKIIPYDAVKHRELATKELIDAGYIESEYKDWIDAIDE